MILIADGGATKAAWVLLNEQKEVVFATNTHGFTPLLHDKAFIIQCLERSEDLNVYQQQVQEIQYYGTGCSSVERCFIVEEALRAFFPNAQHFTIDSDMKGAALAACGQEQGICCIMGTGVNACFFDGENEITQKTPSLGFVLGDEGSGADLGKRLLNHYFYGELPEKLHQAFWQKYQLTREAMLENVYRKPKAQAYLASFAPFLKEQEKERFISNLLHQSFSRFFKVFIQVYPEHQATPIHFIGSIAWHFQDMIRQIGKEQDLKMGQFLKNPIEGLTKNIMVNVR